MSDFAKLVSIATEETFEDGDMCNQQVRILVVCLHTVLYCTVLYCRRINDDVDFLKDDIDLCDSFIFISLIPLNAPFIHSFAPSITITGTTKPLRPPRNRGRNGLLPRRNQNLLSRKRKLCIRIRPARRPPPRRIHTVMLHHRRQ